MAAQLRRVLELILNGVIVVACSGLIVGVLSSRVSLVKRSTLAPAGPPIGAEINIPQVTWPDSKHTIVLVLNTHCGYCTASAGFYRELQRIASARKIPIIAVLPQSNDDARAYLAGLHVPISSVRQLPLSSLQVSATPTLMIVNSDGKLIRSWIGQLPPNLEKEVLSRL
jgi:hypothetical protein